MRILRVAQNLYPEVPGGGSYHVHALSRDQAALGHDVTVLTVSDDASLPRRETRDGYEIRRVRPILTTMGNEIAPGLLRDLRRAGRHDVVHAHSHLYFSTNLAALARTVGSTPLALTNHGLYSQSAPRWLFGAYLRTVGRWTFDAADLCFCYTASERRALLDLGVSSPVEVVTNGVDLDRFTPTGETSDRLADGDPRILSVGRLVEGKRPLDAVAALAKLRGTHPEASLTFFGDGPLRDAIRTRAERLGVDDATSFAGHVEYEAMPAVYRAADALLLPSEAEGLPKTVLEALASGTPVVTTDLPQLAEVLDDGGRTAPVGDVSALAAALSTVVDDGRAASAASRERVEEHFDWDDTVAGVTEGLERLVDGRSEQ